MKIRLNMVRLAFPRLITPEQFQGQGDPYYGATLLMEPTSANAKAIEAAIQNVADAKWGAKSEKNLAGLAEPNRGLRDGDDKDLDGFAGMVYVSATTKERPLLLDQNKTTLGGPRQEPAQGTGGIFYAGCYVNALVEVWAQDNGFGKAIRVTLKGIQFAKDGDAFAGGAPASEDDFDVAEGADAAALV